MAKRKAARRAKPRKSAKKRPAARRSTSSAKKAAAKPPRRARNASRRVKAAAPRRAKPSSPPPKRSQTVKRSKSTGRAPAAVEAAPAKVPKLDRVRRTLDDERVPTPPSSLDMERHGSAVRTGRAEILQNQRQHGQMTTVTGGDVDVNVDNAYFSGDEAPGGDNPTPDMDIVDDIGKALGVEYNDNEELKSGDKLKERDKHRWELNPASSEDYKERD